MPGGGPEEFRRVAELLGHPPRGAFEVVVRDDDGEPLVIRNAPLLDDGTPMPTRYWLVGPALCLAVDRLEAAGGVRAAAGAVHPDELAAAHRRYAAERNLAIPAGWAGPRPRGGVGGTRQGVKCLHAHLAWHLAGGDDPVGEWVAAQLGLKATGGPQSAAIAARDGLEPGVATSQRAPVAAIDCGTNSTRLLVVGADGQTIERLMHITRLGQGVDRTGVLAPEAVERTLAVLRSYREVMELDQVGRARMTATSAARDAVNRDTFLTAAHAVVGVRPELLDGDTEGRLSFAGATAELDPAGGPWLVSDIGGGSTELATGPSPDPEVDRLLPVAVRSLDVGCVRVTERFFSHDPPLARELRAAAAHVARLLTELSRELPVFASAKRLVGLAGTVSAAASISLGLDRYQREAVHHHVLSRSTVDGLLATLAQEPASARRHRAGVEEARADVIVGGLVVLASIMDHFGFEDCLVSEADILDGLAMTLR